MPAKPLPAMKQIGAKIDPLSLLPGIHVDGLSSPASQTIEALYEAFRRRDMSAIFRLLSPDVEIVQSEKLPWGGRYNGHDGARQFFGKLGSHINSTLAIERMIDSGNHVAAIGWTEGSMQPA